MSAAAPLGEGLPVERLADRRRHASYWSLTERELEVLVRYVSGRSERSMATELGISRSSVRSRLEGARRKLEAALQEERA